MFLNLILYTFLGAQHVQIQIQTTQVYIQNDN